MKGVSLSWNLDTEMLYVFLCKGFKWLIMEGLVTVSRRVRWGPQI